LQACVCAPRRIGYDPESRGESWPGSLQALAGLVLGSISLILAAILSPRPARRQRFIPQLRVHEQHWAAAPRKRPSRLAASPAAMAGPRRTIPKIK
jgi:hypothetical protein